MEQTASVTLAQQVPFHEVSFHDQDRFDMIGLSENGKRKYSFFSKRVFTLQIDTF